MALRLRYYVRLLHKKFLHRPVTVILSLLAFIYVISTVLIMLSEKIRFGDASALIMPAFLGELGIVESDSLVTQISCLAALVVSVAFLAIVTAKITSMFVEFCRKGGSIVHKVNLEKHVIICGWNYQGESIVRELLSSDIKTRQNIVVLADYEQRPVENHALVDFLKGDPTQDEDLKRAGIETADSVIVLSDLDKPANEADAEALMIVLAVESLNRDVHTTVQIMRSANRKHLEHAHADEIICMDYLGGHLMVAATVNHGVSRIVSDLLTFDKGSEFYRYDRPLPDKLVGKEFREAVQLLATDGRLLLGIETDDQSKRATCSSDGESQDQPPRRVIVNPQSGYKLRQGDALFLIAESEPDQL
jgi:voltage-gated potassium channel